MSKVEQMIAEQGKREKKEILKAYEINKFLEDLQETTSQMWARIEILARVPTSPCGPLPQAPENLQTAGRYW